MKKSVFIITCISLVATNIVFAHCKAWHPHHCLATDAGGPDINEDQADVVEPRRREYRYRFSCFKNSSDKPLMIQFLWEFSASSNEGWQKHELNIGESITLWRENDPNAVFRLYIDNYAQEWNIDTFKGDELDCTDKVKNIF